MALLQPQDAVQAEFFFPPLNQEAVDVHHEGPNENGHDHMSHSKHLLNGLAIVQVADAAGIQNHHYHGPV